MNDGALWQCDWICFPTLDLRLYTGPGDALPMWSLSAFLDKNTLLILSRVDVPKPNEGWVGFVDKYYKTTFQGKRQKEIESNRRKGKAIFGSASHLVFHQGIKWRREGRFLRRERIYFWTQIFCTLHTCGPSIDLHSGDFISPESSNVSNCSVSMFESIETQLKYVS